MPTQLLGLLMAALLIGTEFALIWLVHRGAVIIHGHVERRRCR